MSFEYVCRQHHDVASGDKFTCVTFFHPRVEGRVSMGPFAAGVDVAAKMERVVRILDGVDGAGGLERVVRTLNGEDGDERAGGGCAE